MSLAASTKLGGRGGLGGGRSPPLDKPLHNYVSNCARASRACECVTCELVCHRVGWICNGNRWRASQNGAPIWAALLPPFRMNAKLQVAVARSCVWACHSLVRNDRGLRKLALCVGVAVTRSDGQMLRQLTAIGGLQSVLTIKVKSNCRAKKPLKSTRYRCVTAIRPVTANDREPTEREASLRI